MKVSIVIPVYNEIRFIERTLFSVVNEADEIIISDNASTDGTSDVCQKYARKYPQIKYIKQNDNIGANNNFRFCINQAQGEYIRLMGAHDMISTNSTKSMLTIFEENKDAVLVFSKNTINLDWNYSFLYSYFASEFADDLISNSPFVRVESLVNKLTNCTMFYGLYKTELLKEVYDEYCILEKLQSDHVILTNLASRGKIFADNNSTFFRITPRREDLTVSWVDSCHRIVKTLRNMDDDNLVNAYCWPLGVICGSYELAKTMQNWPGASEYFSETILDNAIKRFGHPEGFDVSLNNAFINPDKLKLVDYVFNRIQNEKQEKAKERKIDRELLRKIKRLFVLR